MDQLATFHDSIQLYVDSARSSVLSFGCVFKTHWAHGHWADTSIFQQGIALNITLLELYAIVTALELWAPQLQGMYIILQSDSSVTVGWLTRKRSPILAAMHLIRHFNLTFNLFAIPDTNKGSPPKGSLKPKKLLDQQRATPPVAKILPVHGLGSNSTSVISFTTILDQGANAQHGTDSAAPRNKCPSAVKMEVMKCLAIMTLQALGIKCLQKIVHFNSAKKLQALVNFNLACHYGHLPLKFGIKWLMTKT